MQQESHSGRSDIAQKQCSNDSPDYALHPVKGVVWAGFLGFPIASGARMDNQKKLLESPLALPS